MKWFLYETFWFNLLARFFDFGTVKVPKSIRWEVNSYSKLALFICACMWYSEFFLSKKFLGYNPCGLKVKAVIFSMISGRVGKLNFITSQIKWIKYKSLKVLYSGCDTRKKPRPEKFQLLLISDWLIDVKNSYKYRMNLELKNHVF
jgi:hypothetical protein